MDKNGEKIRETRPDDAGEVRRTATTPSRITSYRFTMQHIDQRRDINVDAMMGAHMHAIEEERGTEERIHSRILMFLRPPNCRAPPPPPPALSKATLPTVSLALESCDEWELTALEIATASAKSLVVASALMHREDVRAKDALRWSLLEEHFQIERWGLVEGEHDVSHSESVMWYAACRRFGRLGRELAPDAE